jgi:hypothetical protein
MGMINIGSLDSFVHPDMLQRGKHSPPVELSLFYWGLTTNSTAKSYDVVGPLVASHDRQGYPGPILSLGKTVGEIGTNGGNSVIGARV